MTEEEKKEYMRVYSCKYREQNRSRLSIQQKKWREENRERKRECDRKYCDNNKEQVQEYKRLHRESRKNHCIYLLELPDFRMYVGSTSWLTNRLTNHRNNSVYFPQQLVYQAVNETGGWDNVKVHVIMKDIPNKNIRLKLEQYFIDKIPQRLRLNTYDVRSPKAQ